ncbi:hypothetical protein B0J18DRAFT_144175 [Chaetomium sp. MPI-SDFR-AT-0129]|nr:hypothetical protein B0J18DRAFT_144175 [Chaetomium sp. MPI-SDFR-AT-0129]
MQLTTLFTLLAGTVASVSAAALVPREDPSDFSLTVHKPDSPLHGRALIASESRLWISTSWSKRQALCRWGEGKRPDGDGATFSLDGDKLFLYGIGGQPFQQLGLDPKEDGLDNLKYFSSIAGKPSENFRTDGWRDDGGILSFSWALFQACPVDDGYDTYRVDIYANSSALDKGCVTFDAKINAQEVPLPCTYT